MAVCIFGFALIVGAVFVRPGFSGEGDREGREEKQVFSAHKRSQVRESTSVDRKRALQPKRDFDAIFAKVLERNPGIEPDWKSVPDEKNAFLQWLNFCDEYRGRSNDGLGTWHSATLGLPLDVQHILDGSAEWDAETIGRYLKGNAEFMGELKRIALMPDQSTAGVPVERWHFMDGIFFKQSGQLLCADARLAAELGDSQGALKSTRAAMGLVRMMTQVETPTLIGETLGLIVGMDVLKQSVEHVMPALDLNEEEVGEWRELLSYGREPNLSAMVKGEFYATFRGLVIPAVTTQSKDIKYIKVPDADALYDSFAQHYLDVSAKAGGATYKELWTKQVDFEVLPENLGELSQESQKVAEYFAYSLGVYAKGWTRATAVIRQYDAALAILEGSEPPVEPITGKPFVFDSETRMLGFPSDPILKEIKAEPIKLP